MSNIKSRILANQISLGVSTFDRLNIMVDLSMVIPVFNHAKCFSDSGFFFSESAVFPKWDFVEYSDERVTLEVLTVIWRNVESKLQMVFSKIIEDEEILRKKKELNDRVHLELHNTFKHRG